MSEEQAIRDLVVARGAAISRGDVEGVLAPVQAGAVLYDIAPPLEHSVDLEKEAEGLRAWFAT